MTKHIPQKYMYKLPSGASVFPYRVIIRDGTLMWKHALNSSVNNAITPVNEAHEQHIIKTAYRMEELNSWASQGLELWECLEPIKWYCPKDHELHEGISLYFRHKVHSLDTVYRKLMGHILPHEELEIRNSNLFFRRC